MKSFMYFLLGAVCSLSTLFGEESPMDLLKDAGPEVMEAKDEVSSSIQPPSRSDEIVAYVVQIQDAISKANEFILKRAIKEATFAQADALVIDMDTPGGRLDVTLEMMEMLDRFPGDTFTFVNKDAISAGAYISMVTDSIYFAPNGVMGAAAVVSGGGQEIDESMKAKINSYIFARMRSYTEEYPYRADIIRAMADIDFVLEIDGEVLKSEGELLSLTAKQSVALYGDPAKPLLAEGIADDVESLLIMHYGEGPLETKDYEITWSEELAKFMQSVAPLLLGLGFLALFIEFKTPGFGIFGITGIVMVAIVFLGNYVAGLAGWEGILFFVFGIALILVDLLFLPGTFVFMILGALIAIGSLIWSFADLWPTIGEDGIPEVEWSADAFLTAGYEVSLALLVCLLGLVVFWRFLPKTALFSRMILGDLEPLSAAEVITETATEDDLSGKIGIVSTALRPSGEVDVDGERIEARILTGHLPAGTRVVIVRKESFGWVVEEQS